MNNLTDSEKEIIKSAEKLRDFCHQRMCENCFLHLENDFGNIIKCTLCDNIPMHWKISEFWNNNND